MLALVTISLFSLTENSKFSSSLVYKVMELLAVGSIIGAAGSELIILFYSAWNDLLSCFHHSKAKVKNNEKEEVLETQQNLTSQTPKGLVREPKSTLKNQSRSPKKRRRNKNSLDFRNSPFDSERKTKLRTKGKSTKKEGDQHRIGFHTSPSDRRCFLQHENRIQSFMQRSEIFGAGTPQRVKIKRKKKKKNFSKVKKKKSDIKKMAIDKK